MSMTFSAALSEAGQLLDKLKAAKPDDTGLREELLLFMESEPACRGFFVVLLTESHSLLDLDTPPAVLIEAITTSGDVANSVVARNLVMSAAAACAHRRRGDINNAQGSEQVIRRTQNLIRLLNSKTLLLTLHEMRNTLKGESTAFADFIQRLNYGDDEKIAAIKALDAV